MSFFKGERVDGGKQAQSKGRIEIMAQATEEVIEKHVSREVILIHGLESKG